MENDNLSENISKILNDPEGMAKIQAMAQSLFGEQMEEVPKQTPSVDEMNILKNALSMLKNEGADERGRLLLALKPHLSAERGQRVDKAVKLLRLARLAPLLSQTDLFNL